MGLVNIYLIFLDLRKVPGTGGVAPSQLLASSTTIRDADAALDPAHREPQLFLVLRATAAHQGGATLCPYLIPDLCSRGHDVQASAHLYRHY